MYWFAALLAIVAGGLNTVQAGANLTLGKTLQQPVFAALVVAAMNTVVYLFAAIFVGLKWPNSMLVSQVPWWAWFGGFLGAVYVLAMIFLAENLGAAVFTGLTVTAAIITSIILDHYGMFGFQQHSANLWRLAGCVLMLIGLVVIWEH